MIRNNEGTVPTMSSARVILSTKETQPMALKTKLGNLYAEAESEPRRFAINITDDIRNILSLSRSSSHNAMYTSYLVFIHDGFYDQDYDIFRVILNSNLCTDTRSIVQKISFQKSSIEGIINSIAECLLSLKELNLLDLTQNAKYFCKESDLNRFVNERMKVTVESFHTSDEFCRIANTETMQEKTDFSTQLNKVMEDFDLDLFCEICYENINPTQFDAKPGTHLTKCGHLFCDECCKSHFVTQIKDGAVQMMCPGYQCDSTVGLITLLSLVHVTQVGKLLQRSVEQKLDTCPDTRWCPNPKCGRAICMDKAKNTKEFSLDVVCTCGREMCFSCLSAPHWPAKCYQAARYTEQLFIWKSLSTVTDNLKADKPITNKPKKPVVFEVEGRLCPKCHNFFQKGFGCQYTTCRCGHEFCWLCGSSAKSHEQHFNPCGLYLPTINKYARRLKIYHIDVDKEEKERVAKDTKQFEDRGKTKMFQLALRQRTEANTKIQRKRSELFSSVQHKIIQEAQKDTAFKRQILIQIGLESQKIPLDDASLRLMHLVPHVTKFLRSVANLKTSIHHVAEFTFVLLQDVPNSVTKRKLFRLATDLSSYGCFIMSIFEAGSGQDPRAVIKRLVDIQTWTRRALDTLVSTVSRLRY